VITICRKILLTGRYVSHGISFMVCSCRIHRHLIRQGPICADLQDMDADI